MIHFTPLFYRPLHPRTRQQHGTRALACPIPDPSQALRHFTSPHCTDAFTASSLGHEQQLSSETKSKNPTPMPTTNKTAGGSEAISGDDFVEACRSESVEAALCPKMAPAVPDKATILGS
ncbi:hypothetical protein FCOIX_2069 [Fusarium coicis]|nr:hypothetical protein FCOIX_2069 [Fusarium coicis]